MGDRLRAFQPLKYWGRAAVVLATLLPLSAAAPTAAPAQALIADLSQHLIAITTMFTGSDVVLFGAIDGPGEVVMVVTGPRAPVTVRRKAQTAGIWVNRKSITFNQVPGYYAVAASRPLAELAPATMLARHGIGPENVRLEPSRPMAAEQYADFRNALIRNKQRDGLYVRDVDAVEFLGEHLFRATIHFPANVPVGLYQVEVLLLRDGEVVGAQSTPLAVSKTGFSAEVFEFAHGQPAMYGVGAVMLAAGAGWLANLVFRRR
jgi:uncharacterized protein (TIGR02186 family)